jgi:LPXTG-site transpeptidase (sortase) family protein
MAQELAAGAGSEGGRRRRLKSWHVLLAIGLASMIAGGLLVIGPLISTWNRGQADQSALHNWTNAPGKGAVNATKATCGSASPADYALVKFGGPAQYHYAGVSGDGTWDLLHDRTMVHYHGTPDPGQPGNSIIAFHREPDYQHIDQLAPGDLVTIQDKACHSFTYRITQRWDLPPSQVSQLVPTSGYDLTLITCDPWWQDYDRLVWRATLVGPGGGFVSGNSTAPAGPSTGQPTF